MKSTTTPVIKTGASDPKLSAGLPMQSKGSDSSGTYATLTDGKITIGDKTMSSAKDLGAHTELATASKALAPLLDLKKVIADQKAMSAATGTVIAVSAPIVAKKVDDIGAAQVKEAEKEAAL